jgi:hypothetical protein
VSVYGIGRRRRARVAGPARAVSGAAAWLVLLLASGERESPAWQALLAHDHSRDRAHTWLASHSLADDFPVLRHRARREQLDGHLSEFPLILTHDAVRATGISAAAGLGLTGGRDQAESYAPLSLRASLVQHHALEPVVDGSVLARWVPDAIWAPLDGMERSPSAAVLVDLLEHDDPRVRREAAAALAR